MNSWGQCIISTGNCCIETSAVCIVQISALLSLTWEQCFISKLGTLLQPLSQLSYVGLLKTWLSCTFANVSSAFKSAPVFLTTDKPVIINEVQEKALWFLVSWCERLRLTLWTIKKCQSFIPVSFSAVCLWSSILDLLVDELSNQLCQAAQVIVYILHEHHRQFIAIVQCLPKCTLPAGYNLTAPGTQSLKAISTPEIPATCITTGLL